MLKLNLQKGLSKKYVCKLIAELVGTDKHVMGEILQRLEQGSGAPGVDLRLTGEIYGRLHMKMRELGLDPNDTTPRELYQALLNLTALHDQFLAAKIGIENPRDPKSVLPAVVNLVKRMHFPQQACSLKHVAAKRLLKDSPPKTLMKLLNYRSVDSLLKRESTAMLITVARHIEPIAWQQHFVLSYKKLRSSDFETRNIEIAYLSQQRWQSVANAYSHQKAPILHSLEMGFVAVLPLPGKTCDGLTVASLLLILNYINDIRVHSTYIKFHHMRSGFGNLLTQTFARGSTNHASLAGQPIHWRIIHKYYGSQTRLAHPEIFEPHIQPADLAYRKAEAVLYRIEPALHFWHDLDYVGLPQPDGPLSFNLADMAMNLLNRIPHEQRVSYHMRDAVWNEIYSRYIGQRNLELQVLHQLDQQVAAEPFVVADMEFA